MKAHRLNILTDKTVFTEEVKERNSITVAFVVDEGTSMMFLNSCTNISLILLQTRFWVFFLSPEDHTGGWLSMQTL